MYRVSCTSDIDSVRSIWQEIYAENNELTHFQSFEWNSLLVKYHLYEGCLLLWILYKDDKPTIIAPLVRKDHFFHNDLGFLGLDTHADYLNLIYRKDFQQQDITHLVKHILGCVPRCIWKMNLIEENSIITDYLKEIDMPIRQKSGTLCVKIPLAPSTEEYDRSIPTTQRRIKQKRRKLEREQPSLEYACCCLKASEERLVEEMLDLYARRCAQKGTFFDAEYLSFLKDYLLVQTGFTVRFYRINNSLAAFGMEYRHPNGHDRYAFIDTVDTDYGSYSLGLILLYREICEMIQMSQVKKEAEARLCYLDLSRGAEPYKYLFNAIEHYSKNYILSEHRVLLFLYDYLTKLRYFLTHPQKLRQKLSRRWAGSQASDMSAKATDPAKKTG